MKFKIILLCIYALLIGCTAGAEVEEKDKNRQIICVDTRDGESFEFNTNDVTNIRAGFFGADTSYDVVDSTGRKRTLTKSMEVYLKCETNQL